MKLKDQHKLYLLLYDLMSEKLETKSEQWQDVYKVVRIVEKTYLPKLNKVFNVKQPLRVV